jgi:hypothetical protein
VNPLVTLGIEIDEILDWQGDPSLFTGHDTTGNHYLAVQVAGSSAIRSWLCAPISPVALRYLLDGRAQLRDAFRHTLTGVVAMVSIDRAGRVTESTRLSTDLPDDLLPAEGKRLCCVA